MQGSERREVVSVTQAQPGQPVSATGAPGLSARVPASSQEAGREGRTLAVLAQKAGAIGQELRAQYQQKEFIKGQMTFQQGKTYQELLESGASYGSVAGFQSMNAAKMTDDLYTELVQEIEQGMYQTDPDAFREIMAERFTGLLTGDQMTDNFLTELSAPLARKVAQAHVTAHEAWKVQETKSAARDMLLSKVHGTEPEDQEMFRMLMRAEGPISTLSPEDQKQVYLEAAILGLKQGDRAVLDALGNLDGIRERFSTTAAEESQVLSAFNEFETQAEAQWSSEMKTEFMQVYRAVRTGRLTYEQGLEATEGIVQKYGKGNRTMIALADNVWGAANANMNRIEAERLAAQERAYRELEKAREEAAERQAFMENVTFAVAGKRIAALDTKGQQAAIQMLRNNVVAAAEQAVQDGRIQATDSIRFMQTEYAKVLDEHGVVDPETSAVLTTVFQSANVLDPDGKVYDSTLAGYEQLVELHKLNPQLAMQHLKSQNAKDMFSMAIELSETGESNAAALTQAAQNMKAELRPQDFQDRLGKVEVQEALAAKVKKAVYSETPSFMFIGDWMYGGTDRGEFKQWRPTEVLKAAEDSGLLKEVNAAVKAHLVRNPKLTDEQAISRAIMDIKERGAYVHGSYIVPRHGTLYEAMGLEAYKSESGVPFEAVTMYLQEHGEKEFGRMWYDKTMFRPGVSWKESIGNWMTKKREEKMGIIPEMDVRYGTENGEGVFMISPVLNNGLPSEYSAVIPAKKIGEYYKQLRMQEDSERGVLRKGLDATTRAVGTSVRSVLDVMNTPFGELPAPWGMKQTE